MVKNDRITVGIVIYKPNIERLNLNIIKILNQFERLILYKNSSFDINELPCAKFNKDRITILGDEKNKGIAVALNAIMEHAINYGYGWVLTLDQDSIIPENISREFGKYLNLKQLGIICTQNIDSRRKYMKVINNPQHEYVDMCDTSGSCVNCKTWLDIGGFDEWLFIDLVDNDFCKRIVLNNYKILRLNNVVMDHQYGDIEPKNKIIEKFFLKLGSVTNSVNISKLSFKRNVNPLRIYYENRNVIYLNYKYKDVGGIGYKNHHCKTYIGFMLTFSLYSLIVGKNKKDILNSILTGVKDGRKQIKVLKDNA